MPGPLVLLFRVNAIQSWRRLKSVREQSRLLTGLIVAFIPLGYLGISFWLFFRGLRFVAAFPGLGTVLTERLLYLLFAFLFMLLLLSNLIISYTNLFRNREAGFLMSLPVPAQTIFQWKFFESALLASWAFVFLIAPLLAAFGLTRDVPWHFYPVTLLLIGLFHYCCRSGLVNALAGRAAGAVSGPPRLSVGGAGAGARVDRAGGVLVEDRAGE